MNLTKIHHYPTLAICFLCLLISNRLSAQEKIPQKEIPIVAWFGVPEEEATVERFEELKEAGFTINLRGCSNADQMEKALDAAQKAGIKLIVACPELQSDPETTVKRFMKHPATVGYLLRDEPLASDFPALSEWAKKIQSVDQKHFCYLNLFPNGPQEHLNALGVKSYREYVSRFEAEVPVQFLSFDHYPITYNGMKEEWYENLEEFSDEAKKAGKEFWAFAMSTQHWKYPHPTLATLRLQMFSDLAYGAQGLQYFTYWTPVNSEGFDYQFGPIGLDGRRTVAYDLVRQVNQEIKALSGVFVGAKVLWVRHTGPKIPRGTMRFDKLPEPVRVLETEGTGAVISQLENDGKQFLAIINRDYEVPMRLIFSADPKVKRILKDGSIVPADAYTPVMTVDPGDMILYMWE